MLQRFLSRGDSPAIRRLLGPPAIWAGYLAACAIVFHIGCRPALVDAEFRGVAVGTFLLAALTVAAVTLILFAAGAGWRAFRRAGEPRRSAAMFVLGLVALAATAATAYGFFGASCT